MRPLASLRLVRPRLSAPKTRLSAVLQENTVLPMVLDRLNPLLHLFSGQTRIKKMDFVFRPEDTKNFGSMKRLKWYIHKYPNIFLLTLPVTFIVYNSIEETTRYYKKLNEATYASYANLNQYSLCRKDDWLPQNTPKRYLS